MTDTLTKRPRTWIYSCGLCRRDHPIKTCQRFLQLSPAERFDVVHEHHYCTNCLACSHTKKKCTTDLGCHICHEKHHTLLHFSPQLRNAGVQLRQNANRSQENAAQSQGTDERSRKHDERPTTSQRRHTVSDEPRSTQPSSTTYTRPQSTVQTQTEPQQHLQPNEPRKWSDVFLPTAQLRIAFPKQRSMWHVCRTGLNFYSPVSKIAAQLQADLKLETFQHGGAKFAKFRVTGRSDRFKWSKEIRALVTHDLPKKLYSTPITENPTLEFSADSLADPDPRCNVSIYLELGADEFYDLHRNGSINTDLKYVIAQPSAIGYVFMGPIGALW